MAVVATVRVPASTKDDHDALDDLVNAAIGRLGGPPEGLMMHLTHPDGDGFVIVDVWRTEDEARSFHDSVIAPSLAEIDRVAGAPTLVPAWGIARP